MIRVRAPHRSLNVVVLIAEILSDWARDRA
jgi:hypothetical protein